MIPPRSPSPCNTIAADNGAAASVEFREAIRARCLDSGFSLAGFTTAEPLSPAHIRRWERWHAEDKAGAMQYLMREHPRRTHPRDLMPEARAALVVAAGYYDGDHGAPPEEPGEAGKIARYAWGRDYHEVMKGRLVELGEWIESEAASRGVPNVTTRPCVDSAPVDERALAARAGLGFIGKNTLLLHPQRGSWMLLGVLLMSLELPPDPPLPATKAASCGNCRRCLEACPTRALEDARRMEPRRCISYLTIEQREAIPSELTSQMEGWAFGCDLCQEVCPFNERPLERLLPELAANEGKGSWLTASDLGGVPSGKAFLRRWGHTPLARAGLKGLRRNLEAAWKSMSGNRQFNDNQD